MRIENDLVVISLDNRYQVSFYLAPQKEEEGNNNLMEVSKEGEDDGMEMDDIKTRRPLEGMARYAMLVLIYCGEFFQSSPTRLLTDSLRFVCSLQPTHQVLIHFYGILVLLFSLMMFKFDL